MTNMSLSERGYTIEGVVKAYLRSKNERKDSELQIWVSDYTVMSILKWLESESPLRNADWEVPDILCLAISWGGYYMPPVDHLIGLPKRDWVKAQNRLNTAILDTEREVIQAGIQCAFVHYKDLDIGHSLAYYYMEDII